MLPISRRMAKGSKEQGQLPFIDRSGDNPIGDKPTHSPKSGRTAPAAGQAAAAQRPSSHAPEGLPASPSDPAAHSMPEPEVLTVARLDRLIKRVIEGATANVRVRGEVSGLHRAGSGHLYFSLKDEREDALIDCVMYRSARAKARHALRDGESVVLAGRATVYARRGRMQFVADDLLQTARGALLEALEKLKAKLAAEGLFAPERKKPLPAEPRCIAVLTSRDGAAIHDVVRVAFRRGRVRILLVPTPVQGVGAAERIADAIDDTDRLEGIDVIVVTRGGGSAEDLAAYNDELVVRAIARARHPVVSAVGHEIDVSLSDLVADARAATPSQAAELIVPDDRQQRASLEHLAMRLRRAVQHRVAVSRERALRLERRLGEPRRRVLEEAQRFDELTSRLERSTRRRIAAQRSQAARLATRLHAQHPRRVLSSARAAIGPMEMKLAAAIRDGLSHAQGELDRTQPRLEARVHSMIDTARFTVERSEPALAAAMSHALHRAGHRLASDVARLDALSPLRVLQRGYAIATNEDGRALLDAGDVRPGARIDVRLHHGTLSATVDSTDKRR